MKGHPSVLLLSGALLLFACIASCLGSQIFEEEDVALSNPHRIETRRAHLGACRLTRYLNFTTPVPRRVKEFTFAVKGLRLSLGDEDVVRSFIFSNTTTEITITGIAKSYSSVWLESLKFKPSFPERDRFRVALRTKEEVDNKKCSWVHLEVVVPSSLSLSNDNEDEERDLATRDASQEPLDAFMEPLDASIKVLPEEVVIVTFLGETSVQAYNKFDTYERLSQLTLPSIQQYAASWGHPLRMMPEDLLDLAKQPYWAKITLMEHYLSQGGYKYLLYTDIDVIFLEMDKPLSSFIVPGKDIIGVDECKSRNDTNSAIRSGFLLLRNSPMTMNFLKLWRESFSYFKDIENPEQSALEFMVKMPQFASAVHLHSWKNFHSYDTCDGHQSSFSMHFPGPHKLMRVGREVAWLNLHGPDLLDFSADVIDLANTLTGMPLNLSAGAKPSINDAAFRRVASCLLGLKAEGYNPPPYNATQHNDVLSYDLASLYFNIPTVVYLTLPNATAIPEEVDRNVQKWKDMNPTYTVEIYDDKRMEELVLKFLDVTMQQWQALLPVQRADIWRYLVIYLFGGWYFDADVEPMKPMTLWGHATTDTLVVGVEAERVTHREGYDGRQPVVLAQYAFGAAAKHPAIKHLLDEIVNSLDSLTSTASSALTPEERLNSILTTTGPFAWTESVLNFMCYSDSYPTDPTTPTTTPSTLVGGHRVVNARVFPIGGFGAGQQHSGSPTPESDGVNAWHHFGSSVWFHGKKWSQISASDISASAPTTTGRVLAMCIMGWHAELVPPLSSAAMEFEKLGYRIKTLGMLNNKRTAAELESELQDMDVVLWWNWREPSTPILKDLRKRLTNQLWVVFNWDDPQTMMLETFMAERVDAWDIVFSSGEAAIPLYKAASVKDAIFLPPGADLDLFYPSLSTLIGQSATNDCDVVFTLTNLYQDQIAQVPTVDRKALIQALAEAANQSGFSFYIYGPESINVVPNRENVYKGYVSYEGQREVFSRCKISINLHVNNGLNGRYANERDVLIPASGGLMLVDNLTPSLFDETECLFMRNSDPKVIVQQVKDILREYQTAEGMERLQNIRMNGMKKVQHLYSMRNFTSTIDAHIRRHLPLSSSPSSPTKVSTVLQDCFLSIHGDISVLPADHPLRDVTSLADVNTFLDKIGANTMENCLGSGGDCIAFSNPNSNSVTKVCRIDANGKPSSRSPTGIKDLSDSQWLLAPNSIQSLNSKWFTYQQDLCAPLSTKDLDVYTLTGVLDVLSGLADEGLFEPDIFYKNFGSMTTANGIRRVVLYDYNDLRRIATLPPSDEEISQCAFSLMIMCSYALLRQPYKGNESLVPTSFTVDMSKKEKFGAGYLPNHIARALRGVAESHWSAHWLKVLRDEISSFINPSEVLDTSYQKGNIDIHGTLTLTGSTLLKGTFLFEAVAPYGIQSDKPFTLLDAGSNIGLLGMKVAQVFPHSSVLMLNINDGELAEGQRIAEELDLPNVEFRRVSALAVNDEQFDIVAYFALLHHLLLNDDIDTLLAHVRKQAKGLAVIEIPLKGDALLDMVVRKLQDNSDPWGTRYLPLASVNEFKEALQRHFFIEKETPVIYEGSSDLVRHAFILKPFS